MAEYYPPTSFFFRVLFKDLKGVGKDGEASFKEISGLGVNNSVETVSEGGLLEYQHKLPSTYSYTNIVLKRGLVLDSALKKWVEEGLKKFEFTPLTVMIELLEPGAEGREPKVVMSWTIHNTWPVKWELSNFNAQQNEIAIETLELAFSYMETK